MVKRPAMKKTLKTTFTLLSLSLLTAGCTKVNPATEETQKAGHRIITVLVEAEKEQPSNEDGTKTTYDAATNTFGFDSDDKLQILVGKYEGDEVVQPTTASEIPLLSMDPEHPGHFSGTIDISGYDISDIHGAVLVKSATTGINLYSSSLLIRVPYAANQTQNAAGTLTSANGRFPFHTHLTESMMDFDEETNTLTIKALTMKMGFSVWEYHVYGADRTDEKVLSINVASSGTNNNTSYFTNCTSFFKSTNGNYDVYGSTKYYNSTVTLTNSYNVPSSNGDAIWQCLWGADTGLKLGVVTVTTDKAVYTRDFGGAQIARKRGYIYPININIGSDGNFCRNIEISTDGGNTWEEWTDELPSGTSYTSLKVRGKTLTAAKLNSMLSWVNSQASTVDLDLSGVFYESTTFPKVFGNTTSSSACKKIKSIAVPCNVTTLANGAFYYCTALVSVDLGGHVSTLENNAFRGCTSLATIDHEGVTSVGRLCYSVCSKLKSLGTVSTITTIKYSAFYKCPLTGEFTFDNVTTLEGYSGNATFGETQNKMTKVYLPKIKTVGQRSFYNNTSINTIDLGSSLTSIATVAFSGCTKLKTIYIRATTVPTIAADAFTNVTEATLYVPAASLEAYQTALSTYTDPEGSYKWAIEAIPSE